MMVTELTNDERCLIHNLRVEKKHRRCGRIMKRKHVNYE